jgi:4-hydroxybenzoate polyprenyltransferase
MVVPLIQSLRPKQWTKNFLLFAGLIFSEHLFEQASLIRALAGFVLFCLLSSGEYLINDLMDLEKDRTHPVKSKRPLASGKVSIPVALITSLILLTGSLFASFVLGTNFGWIALSYALMILAYSLFLKRVVILDVIVVAMGFVLRATAGAVVIRVSISSWLLVCAVFLALFLAMCKRRHELVLLGEDATTHRKILYEYSPYLLDQMIAVVTASTVMAYALYTTASETVEKFGTRNLIFTLPFVLYGIFRYLYLVHQKNLGGSPELVLLKDRPMQLNLLLYGFMVGFILYSR